jgi:hypothetical protein
MAACCHSAHHTAPALASSSSWQEPPALGLLVSLSTPKPHISHETAGAAWPLHCAVGPASPNRLRHNTWQSWPGPYQQVRSLNHKEHEQGWGQATPARGVGPAAVAKVHRGQTPVPATTHVIPTPQAALPPGVAVSLLLVARHQHPRKARYAVSVSPGFKHASLFPAVCLQGLDRVNTLGPHACNARYGTTSTTSRGLAWLVRCVTEQSLLGHSCCWLHLAQQRWAGTGVRMVPRIPEPDCRAPGAKRAMTNDT